MRDDKNPKLLDTYIAVSTGDFLAAVIRYQFLSQTIVNYAQTQLACLFNSIPKYTLKGKRQISQSITIPYHSSDLCNNGRI